MTGPTHLDVLAQLRESRERDRASARECCQNFPHAAHETPCEQTPTADLTALADTVEDATSGTLDYEVCWQIARYLTAAGFGPVRAVEAERDLAAQVRQACDAAGIPHDVGGLIRHHRGNAATAAAMDALAVEAERDALRERITALHRSGRMSFDHSDLRALLDASPDREGGACPPDQCGPWVSTASHQACVDCGRPRPIPPTAPSPDREGSDQ